MGSCDSATSATPGCANTSWCDGWMGSRSPTICRCDGNATCSRQHWQQWTWDRMAAPIVSQHHAPCRRWYQRRCQRRHAWVRTAKACGCWRALVVSGWWGYPCALAAGRCGVCGRREWRAGWSRMQMSTADAVRPFCRAKGGAEPGPRVLVLPKATGRPKPLRLLPVGGRATSATWTALHVWLRKQLSRGQEAGPEHRAEVLRLC